MKKLIIATGVLLLAGCETPTTPRYSVSADNVSALRHLNLAGVAVGEIAEPAKDDANCRLAGQLKTQDNLTHAQYVKKALADELKVAGAYAEAAPRVTLTGVLQNVNASSMHGLNSGEWRMTLRLNSSNGNTMTVLEDYRFKSGFGGEAACRNVAQAFLPAVQDLVQKVITSPDFRALVE